jgi:hypothetical protein
MFPSKKYPFKYFCADTFISEYKKSVNFYTTALHTTSVFSLKPYTLMGYEPGSPVRVADVMTNRPHRLATENDFLIGAGIF